MMNVWIGSVIGILLIILSVFIIVWWLNRTDPIEPVEPKDANKPNELEETKETKEAIDPIKPEEVIEPEVVPETKDVCIPVEQTKIKKKRKLVVISPNSNFRSKGEALCCQTMERIFGKTFRTVRPSFLRNPETGRHLELDCYNDDLKIAVEYNGIQHYEWPNFTNMSRDAFIKQVQRDKLKVELCDRNGVFLLTVPYHISLEDIPQYIRQQLQKHYPNYEHL